MGVSRLQPTGGANDFTLDVGSSGQTVFELTKEYAPGAYSITSQLADASLDIYLVNADGSSAGYTSSKSLTATKGFNKIVIYGASTNDLLIFEYKTTFSPTAGGSTLVPAVAPFVTSVSPSDLPDIDDTTTITGGNFATDVEVTFTGTNAVALDAKSIVRASATSILVTRPDTLIQDHSPYDVTVSNPGATAPTGSNVHKLNDAITAGGAPVWVTSAGALTNAFEGEAYSATVGATDPDGGTITYSLATGSLPTGLSLNGSNGVISGTPTTIESQNFTIAATDTGGNITNRSFSLEVGYSASGGTITESNGFRIHTFTSSGTFSSAVEGLNTTVILLGGGGGGSSGLQAWASGGGGGGYLEVETTFAAGAFAVTVGAAGVPQTVCNNAYWAISGKGGDSSVLQLVAGGGFGGGARLEGQGANTSAGGTNITTGAATVLKNYSGGNGGNADGDFNNFGGNNGLRQQESASTYGQGAAGVANVNPGTNATGNGNGGGGGPSCQSGHRGGGAGSQGIVIIRYPI